MNRRRTRHVGPGSKKSASVGKRVPKPLGPQSRGRRPGRSTALAVIPAGSRAGLAALPAPRRLLEAALANLSAASRRAYRTDWEDFSRFSLGTLFTPEHRPAVAEAVERLLAGGPGGANEQVLAWRADMRERKLSAATINRRLAAIRSLVKLGRTLGLVNWTIEVPSLKSEPYRDTRGPGAEGFAAMLATIKGRSPRAVRDRAILRLLFDLALRRAEVVALDLGDVELGATGVSPALGPQGPVAAPVRGPKPLPLGPLAGGPQRRGLAGLGAEPTGDTPVVLEHGRLWVLGKGKTDKLALSLPAPTAAALGAWLQRRSSILDLRYLSKGPMRAAALRGRQDRRSKIEDRRSKMASSALFLSMDPAGKGDGRLSAEGIYKLVRRCGRLAGLKRAQSRPHGLRHAGITAAVEAATAAGIGIEEVLDYSRHANVATLMLYRDRIRNVQGQLAADVARRAAIGPPRNRRPPRGG